MPSTSKKQHNFMAAIANNPSFAKKAGVPQSVGKDFSSADKGRKFEKGGATMMGKKIPSAMADMMARRRPRMGAGMPPPAPPVMPPQPPAPMGMKKGGKVRRFQEGGFSEAQEAWLSKDGGKPDRTDPHILERMRKAVPDEKTQAPAPVEERSFTPVAQYAPKVEGRDTYGNDSPDGDVGGGRTTDFKAAPKAVSQAAPKATSQAAPSKPRSLASGVNQGDVRRSEPKDGSSFGSRSNQGDIRAYDNAQSAKEKADAAELYRESNRPNSKPKEDESSKSLASRVNQGDVRRSEPVTKSETNTGAVTGRVDKVSKNMPSAAKKEENTERLRRADQLSSMAERKARFANRRSAANAKEAAYDARRASDMEAGFKKGGLMKYAKGGMAHGGMHKMPNGKMMKNSDMKESKAMVGKEMMFMKKKGAPASMIKHEKAEMGMKKGGMPMKDGKPAFMMGKKKMMGGGMAGYAKGGGIESRGKTKGTVIRMAAGGSVASRRADGIAQRGKTRC